MNSNQNNAADIRSSHLSRSTTPKPAAGHPIDPVDPAVPTVLTLGEGRGNPEGLPVPAWNVIGQGNGDPVSIDMREPRIMLVCGSRGSGKSQTLGVLAESLALSGLAVGVVLVDRCGVFRRMDQLAQDRELDPASAARISDLCRRVRVFEPLSSDATPLRLSASELTASDWCQFLGIPSEGPRRDLLEHVCRLCRRGYRARGGRSHPEDPDYTVEGLTACIDSADSTIDLECGYTRMTRRAVVQRLIAADSTGLFTSDGLDISDLSVPGQISVIDLSSPALSERAASTVVCILARWILARRFQSVRSGRDLIPVTWLCVDEAHLFTGKETTNGSADSDLVQYCKIGRKPGCALVLATQQPGAMSPAILSQVDSVIAHKLAFRGDLDALNKIVPDIDSHTINALRSFVPGQALLADHAVETELQEVQIRRRYTRHDGESARAQPIKADQAQTASDQDCYNVMKTGQDNQSSSHHDTEIQPQPNISPSSISSEPARSTSRSDVGGSDHARRSHSMRRLGQNMSLTQPDHNREATTMKTHKVKSTFVHSLGVLVASLVFFFAGWFGTLKGHDLLYPRIGEEVAADAAPVEPAPGPLDETVSVTEKALSDAAEQPPLPPESSETVLPEERQDQPYDTAEETTTADRTLPPEERATRGRVAMERITSALNRLSK